ncbi:MAG: hypothetical protein AB1511_08230 [Deinococcota bacterium]
MGWLGAELLIVSGYGWGTRLASPAKSPVPLPVMLLTLGAVGTLAAAALAVFTARE